MIDITGLGSYITADILEGVLMNLRFIFLLSILFYTISSAQLVYWEKVFNQNNIFDLKASAIGFLFGGRQGLDGILKSTDAGNTWLATTLNDVICRIAFDDSNNVYAAQQYSPGIYKSTDNGNTWNIWFADAFRVRSMCITKEGCFFAGNESGGLYKSSDNGLSWTSQSITDKEISSILSLSDGQLFLSTLGRGIFTSNDSGNTWTQINNANLTYTIYSFISDKNDNLYAGHWDKISKSTDRGLTWELIGNFNITSESVLDVDDSNNVYYAHHGIYKSTDSGSNWSYLGGPNYIKAICTINNKIFLGTYDGIYRYDPDMPIYVGNNYLPLQVGNKWQYFGTEEYYFQGITSYSYFLTLVSVNSDTVINGIKYYKYHSDWVRYSEEDKKIYVWVNNSDRLYLDMQLIPATPFNQYSIFSTWQNHVFRTAKQLHGNTTIFGVTSNYKGFVFDSSITYNQAVGEVERYVENFGMAYFYYGASPNLGRTSVVIMAILHDSLGFPVYYTNHFKPQISILPLTIVGTNVFDMTFIVEHHYSKSTWYYNFIDSVYMESFYRKNDTTIYNNNILASLYANTFSYRINTILDSTLLKSGYSFYYRIVAKDKGLIKETSIAPDTGYYKCVWDFSTGLAWNKELNEFALMQNFPNPFNPSTNIRFQIPKQSFVTLKIFDVLGRQVGLLIHEEKSPGIYQLSYDASGLANGTYFYQLTADDFIQVKKMQVMK